MKYTESERSLIILALKHSSGFYRTLARECPQLQTNFLQQAIDAAALAERIEAE